MCTVALVTLTALASHLLNDCAEASLICHLLKDIDICGLRWHMLLKRLLLGPVLIRSSMLRLICHLLDDTDLCGLR